jgi:hypothetical protein
VGVIEQRGDAEKAGDVPLCGTWVGLTSVNVCHVMPASRVWHGSNLPYPRQTRLWCRLRHGRPIPFALALRGRSNYGVLSRLPPTVAFQYGRGIDIHIIKLK